MIKSYKDLEVWQKSIKLVKKVYIITKKFPKEEIYGLTNQMRRAAISIPSNIAEELDYLNEKDRNGLLENVDHIARMIRSLIKSLYLSTYSQKPIT